MKTIITTIFIFISSINVGQQYGNIWYFGKNTGIDFSNCTPVLLNNGRNSGGEGCATVCHVNGTLQFYTNSDSVWNAQHKLMANGHLLNSSGTLSQVLAIRKPLSPSEYFIFTTPFQATTAGFQFHMVDMSLNGGLGAVTSKNNTITTLITTEQVAATWHSNNMDHWVVTHEYGTDKFLSYLLSSQGLSTTPVVSAVGPVHGPAISNMNARGEIKFSPSGNKIAFNANGTGQNPNSDILCILDFNQSTGIVSNPVNLPYLRGEFGLSFSSSGSKLYCATWKAFAFQQTDYNYLYQFDLSSGNPTTILSSRVKIDSLSIAVDGSYGSIKLAPNGKIYVARSNASALGVINQPNLAGAACQYSASQFSLGSSICLMGLNNYIEYQTYCNDVATSVAENNPDDGLHIYPHPATTESLLELPDKTRRLEIYNSLGQLVYDHAQFSKDKVRIRQFVNEGGIYFLQISTPEKVIRQRILVK